MEIVIHGGKDCSGLKHWWAKCCTLICIHKNMILERLQISSGPVDGDTHCQIFSKLLSSFANILISKETVKLPKFQVFVDLFQPLLFCNDGFEGLVCHGASHKPLLSSPRFQVHMLPAAQDPLVFIGDMMQQSKPQLLKNKYIQITAFFHKLIEFLRTHLYNKNTDYLFAVSVK